MKDLGDDVAFSMLVYDHWRATFKYSELEGIAGVLIDYMIGGGHEVEILARVVEQGGSSVGSLQVNG